MRGVRGMDAAAKPPWMGLRRPRNPTPPRHPTECQLLTLLWPWPLRVQGAALPKPTPTMTAVTCPNARCWRKSGS
ncbi:hypothetical protein B9Y66_06420 [Stenotrophomonas maltophilia]|nr:hypothetical protein B9Y66_06420 [Stenotrophomonas maltophilia]